MRLTKKLALEICRDLWNWLGENPGRDKQSWPGWRSNGGDIQTMVALCPCCEYVHRGKNRKCRIEKSHCPLSGLWHDTDKSVRCVTGYFAKWENVTDPESNSLIAFKIRDAAIQRLDELSRK